MVKIVITGPESSGKTTLSNALAQFYKVDVIGEYARKYMVDLNRPYSIEDIVHITYIHLGKLALKSTDRLQICDTSFLVLKIWAQEKYGHVPELILSCLEDVNVTLYILCNPDIPWEEDPLRENPTDRDRLFKMYKNELDAIGHPYIVVSGTSERRLTEAKNTIDLLLQD